MFSKRPTATICFPQYAFADLTPFEAGNKWVYTGTVNGQTREFTQEIVSVETKNKKDFYLMESRMNGVTTNLFKFHLDSDALYLISRTNRRGVTIFSPPRKELLRNAKIGDKWNWKAKNNVDHLEHRVLRKERVKVPAGTFDAIVVITTGFMEGVTLGKAFTWYVDKIGTVKEEVRIHNKTMSRELVRYKVN